MSAIKTADGRYSIHFSYHEKGHKRGERGAILRDKRGRRLVRVVVIDNETGVPLTSASAPCSHDEPRFLTHKGRLVALRYATANRMLVPKALRAELFRALTTHHRRRKLPSLRGLSNDQLWELRSRIDAQLSGAEPAGGGEA